VDVDVAEVRRDDTSDDGLVGIPEEGAVEVDVEKVRGRS
jgi:hypothetical protein